MQAEVIYFGKMKCSLIKLDEFKRMIRINEFCHGMGLAAWAKY